MIWPLTCDQNAHCVQAGDPIVGPTFSNTSHEGASISLSLNDLFIAFGGPEDDSNTGSVWVYRKSNVSNTWISDNLSKIKGSSGVGASLFGSAVQMSKTGKILVVGGPGDNNDAGRVWIFETNPNPTDQPTMQPSVNLASSASPSQAPEVVVVACVRIKNLPILY